MMKVCLFHISLLLPLSILTKTNQWLTTIVDTKEEDLTHPEDIAHFKKHDLEADGVERQEQLDKLPIIEQNIPQKFRRHS